MARTPKLQSLYNSNLWKKITQTVRKERGHLCERCGMLGEIVHHIEPLTEENMHDYKIAYGLDNLMLVCRKCHKEIHDELEGKPKRIEFDSDGNLIEK
jgi:5-methylcytosine-specific restriction endonuclease McrA